MVSRFCRLDFEGASARLGTPCGFVEPPVAWQQLQTFLSSGPLIAMLHPGGDSAMCLDFRASKCIFSYCIRVRGLRPLFCHLMSCVVLASLTRVVDNSRYVLWFTLKLTRVVDFCRGFLLLTRVIDKSLFISSVSR